MRRGPTLPELDEFPEIRRREALEWSQHMKQLGELLMGLLMKEMTFIDGRMMIGNYYPYCPQPDLTDHHGGLQCNCGDNWVDVKPVPGALVVDIGDVLKVNNLVITFQIVDHRALANSSREAQVSAVVFFRLGYRDRL
ncbi:Fe2OG dioxygenase domain-containing protein [Citrus sinensis]|uniref:Fe2OG dioxygenase domain-containing protein n=1 Tax=Citrus sinensis TaxID=2711 RepID=A0ACB8N8Y0_CITSI|nr:Fe2OG dioxygenase domain-containing protein [Citrus sinensis]